MGFCFGILPVPSVITQLAGLLLAPVWLSQGLYVRATTPRLPEPPGPRSGTEGEGPVRRLLIIGDSSAAGVGAVHQSAALSGQLRAGLRARYRLQWRLLAETGLTTRACHRRLQRLEPEPVDAVVTALGVNDVTGGAGLAAWQQGQTALVGLLRSRFAARHIILSGLPPVSRFPALPQPLRWYLGQRAVRFDRCLENLAAREQCHYIAMNFTLDPDLMAADGFHPGPGIYAAWGEAAAARLEQLM